jgi:AraC-like DNA-binding protein
VLQEEKMPAPVKIPPTFFSPQVLEARRFYLDLAPAARKPVAVVCGGWERCMPDYAIHRLTFPYHSIEFVCEHLRLRTQAQIARECHVNPAYLCRLFRRYDHQTPYQYLMRLKMNLAAQRLRDPGSLVKQVAAALGFSDPFHFSRAFKSVFGLSPEAFRRLR